MNDPRRAKSTDMALYVQIGSLIKKNREAKRVSQERLASRVGLSRTSVTNIERGRQKFLVHTLAAIAETLGVTMNDLIPSADQKLPLEQRLPQNLRKKEREWITGIVEKTLNV